MGPRKVARGERPDDRELSAKRQSCCHFGEGPRLVRPGEAQDPKARLLRRQAGSASNGADNEVGKRHGGVETAVVRLFEPGHSDRGLGYAGCVLSTGYIERGKTVGIL